MSFYELIKEYKTFNFKKFYSEVTDEIVISSIYKEKHTIEDFLILTSPKAKDYLEEMAVRANGITEKQFGKTILLYTPIYIANYCVNKCAYCGYNVENQIARKKLTMGEVEVEAKAVAAKGFKHVLLLTGESSFHTPTDYIVESVKIFKKYFSSIVIEIFPMDEEDYKKVVEAGADGLTVYQETYDEEVYDRVHIAGPKKDYKYRLDAPERGCKAGMRAINIGALLGLKDWREELFFTAIHGEYLQKKYPWIELAFSLPRIRPHAGFFEDLYELNDSDYVQAMVALRIVFQRCGINVSTRESSEFRSNLIPLGVTKMSAAVSTGVGGHTMNKAEMGEEQFLINDEIDEVNIKKMIRSKGYEPIMKDWA